MSSKTERNIKRAIVILSVFLLILVCLLMGVIYYYERVAPTVVPDNMITTGSADGSVRITPRKTSILKAANMPEHADEEGTDWKSTDDNVLWLYKGQNYDETSFAVSNMFPGDHLYKEYLLQVRHKGTVTVHFTAEVDPTTDPVGEKLEEVLMCKVEIDGETVYDGLMRDIPASLDYTTPTSRRAVTTGISYKITAYLDGPGVGNAHMDKSLVADFQWWVLVDREEESTTSPDNPGDSGDSSGPGGSGTPSDPNTPSEPDVPEESGAPNDPSAPTKSEDSEGELAALPKTGDDSVWYISVALVSGILLWLLLRRKKREEDKNGR